MREIDFTQTSIRDFVTLAATHQTALLAMLMRG